MTLEREVYLDFVKVLQGTKHTELKAYFQNSRMVSYLHWLGIVNTRNHAISLEKMAILWRSTLQYKHPNLNIQALKEKLENRMVLNQQLFDG